ncbi:LPXTG cell wall anchor domain-containing protein [Streptomyces sp. NPDC001770]
MPSQFLRRSRGAAAVLGLSVALPLCGAASAQAHEANRCGSIGVEYTADRGQHWFSGGVIAQEAPATRIDVRLKGEPAEGCQYVVSLASYGTEGPNWAVSGTQTFLGWDSVVLTRDLRQTVLDVSAFTPECFGQIDLYSGDRKYDGKDAPVPHYPDSQIGSHLIAHWNGGSACTVTPPMDTPPTGTPTTPPATTPTPDTTTPPPVDTPPPSTTPTTVPPAPAPSTTPATDTPSPSASTTPPAAATPDEPPTSSTVPGTLASTGGDSTTTLVTTLGAITLVAIGVGLYVFTRRRRYVPGN